MKLEKFMNEMQDVEAYDDIGTESENMEGFAAGNDMRVLMDNNTTFKAKIRNATVDFKYTDLRDALKDQKINITSVTQARKIWNTVKNFII